MDGQKAKDRMDRMDRRRKRRQDGGTDERTNGRIPILSLSIHPTIWTDSYSILFFYLPILTFWRTTLLPTYLLILLTYLPTETDSHPSIPPFSYSPYHSPKPPNLLINPSFSPSSLLLILLTFTGYHLSLSIHPYPFFLSFSFSRVNHPSLHPSFSLSFSYPLLSTNP